MLKTSQTRELSSNQQPSIKWHVACAVRSLTATQAQRCSQMFRWYQRINLTVDDSEVKEVCEGCGALGKISCNSFPKGSSGTIKTIKPLELVHSDVMEPMKTKSMRGAKYVLTFIDDSFWAWASLKSAIHVWQCWTSLYTINETIIYTSIIYDPNLLISGWCDWDNCMKHYCISLEVILGILECVFPSKCILVIFAQFLICDRRLIEYTWWRLGAILCI